MLKARKLGVHTPGAPCFSGMPPGVRSCSAHSRPHTTPLSLSCCLLAPPAHSTPTRFAQYRLCAPTAVVYHVDNATSSIYMERVEGHSLKTLLHGGDLGGAGERRAEHVALVDVAVVRHQ